MVRKRAYTCSPCASHAPGQVHSQVPRASVMHAHFSAVVGHRFGLGGPQVAAVRFVMRVLERLRNAGRDGAAANASLEDWNCTKRRSTRVSCHNRTFDGSGLAIVRHSLSNDK